MPSQKQGTLYLFLGYASGVGKTHTMLGYALQQHQQGLDVGIAYVRNYASAGYLDMAGQLEHIPVGGSSFPPVDVDAVIRRKPQVVVIDDFHTCNPTPVEPHRWYEQLQEILDAGIDIYTTLSLYYVNSQSDTIERLTGIRVEQTVPDRLLNRVGNIQLVDVPVGTVIERLTHKTVAPLEPLQSGLLCNEQTLTTLRQLTMRHASNWIAEQSAHQINTQPEAADDRLMVCISSSPLSAKLIRAADQLARELKTEWIAVYVENSTSTHHDESSQNRLIQNMHLVEKLGGKVVTIHGDSVADTLLRYARQHGVTKLIIGYPTKSRWHRFWQEPVVDRLIQKNSDMDIYVMSSAQPEESFVDFVGQRTSIQWQKYILTLLIITATTLLDIFIRPFVFPATLVTLYVLGIAAVAVYLGNRPAWIATLLSVVSFFFFFIPSSVDTPIETMPYFVILVGLLFTGVVLTRFITGAIDRADTAYRRADQMMELYSLSRDLSTTIAFDGILDTIVTHVKHTFQADVSIYLSQDDNLRLYQATPGFPSDEVEKRAADEAFMIGQTTGISTPKCAEAAAIYVPLRTAHKKVGVMGVALHEQKSPSLDQHRMLDAFASQAALAMEASRLVEQAHQTRLAYEREKLQVALLDSISHDLRTPLVSITGALSSLRDEANLFDAQMRVELIDDAWLETERLNRLVENLLEMSRLQSGELTLNRDWHDLDEIIAVARSQLRDGLRDYQIVNHIQQDNVALIYVDFMLMVQVLVNLLDNAAKYSPEAGTIEICIERQPSWVVLQIADWGTGIPESELPYIFNKFYRASNVASINGTGLGLSICAGIVEAHNGSIHAYNRPEGGAIFEVRLPMEEIRQ